MRWIGNLSLIICCALSAGIITGTVSWMGNHAPQFTADEALTQANQSLNKYCVRHRLEHVQLKLVNATAPQTLFNTAQSIKGQWQFKFYSPQTGLISVQVPEDKHRLAIIKPLS